MPLEKRRFLFKLKHSLIKPNLTLIKLLTPGEDYFENEPKILHIFEEMKKDFNILKVEFKEIKN